MSNSPEKVGNLSESHAQIIREMIRHENDLTSARMGWMTTLQGLLFTALGIAINCEKYKPLVNMLPIVGIVTSLLTAWGIWSAARAINSELLKWWEENEGKGYRGPPIIGLTGSSMLQRYITPWQILPVVFLLSWFFVLTKL